MTAKERILKALNGERPDRVPFCPFLTYWWEAQDEALTGKGELEFLESIGADPLFRGHYPQYGKNGDGIMLFQSHIEDCEIHSRTDGRKQTVTYHTSKGDLVFGYQFVEEGSTWFLTDHPLKEEKDFLLLKYIMDNTRLEPDFARFEEETEKLGDRGLLLPLICPEMKSSFQSLLEHWAGTEALVYSVMDFPETVQETLDSMYRVSREAAEIASISPAPFFLSWEDTSTTNISPQFYRDYILPEINMWCDILHRGGKRYIQHACGRLHALLPDIAGSKIDVLESISPAPTGDVTFEETARILPRRIAIVGGIEPVHLLNAEPEDLAVSARALMDTMKDRGYILANSDSCPPGVTVEKFRTLAQTAHSFRY